MNDEALTYVVFLEYVVLTVDAVLVVTGFVKRARVVAVCCLAALGVVANVRVGAADRVAAIPIADDPIAVDPIDDLLELLNDGFALDDERNEEREKLPELRNFASASDTKE